jgi:plastocyanin/Cu/Ag efflux protein CusF
MKKLLLTTALMMLVTPALAREYTVKEISDPAGKKPYYFEPSRLTIQPGDTVTFVNAQEDTHDVMFDVVPRKVDAMIMGPEQEKEGSKWSYTFTVPGSYHFHCHPHEALGMKGSLIVGQASARGDTKNVDHDAMAGHMKGMKMAGHGAANVLPQGTGKINSIDAEKHTVNVTHQPIEALKWPGMTMDFPVAKDVDLSGFKAGDSVTFTLKTGDNNQYSVVGLKKSQ